MPNIGFTRSPKVQKGAMVQLLESVHLPIPNIVPFQYNPASVKRAIRPWTPPEIDPTNRGPNAPQDQPHEPPETINIDIELDASDQLEDDDTIANQFGIADRIAALEKMLYALPTPIGQLLDLLPPGAADKVSQALGKISPSLQPAAHKIVPITFIVLGAGRMVPVRITSYSIEEQLFLPSLYPIQAKVSLGLNVLTPEMFQSLSGPSIAAAKGAYAFFRKQQDGLALLQTARLPDAIRSLLPFG
ncbi:MAG TPA: hypothetical protein VIF57_25685 [Polyangia bacterium]|jgi:hypothetical protein